MLFFYCFHIICTHRSTKPKKIETFYNPNPPPTPLSHPSLLYHWHFWQKIQARSMPAEAPSASWSTTTAWSTRTTPTRTLTTRTATITTSREAAAALVRPARVGVVVRRGVVTTTTVRVRPTVAITSSARSSACGTTSSGTGSDGGAVVRTLVGDAVTNRVTSDVASVAPREPDWPFRPSLAVAAPVVVVAVLATGKVSRPRKFFQFLSACRSLTLLVERAELFLTYFLFLKPALSVAS